MNQYVPEILLWLFVMNLGIAYGAGLYEKRIILPQWFSRSGEAGFRVNSEAMRQTNTGLRFWAYVTTVPLICLRWQILSLRCSQKVQGVTGGSLQGRSP